LNKVRMDESPNNSMDDSENEEDGDVEVGYNYLKLWPAVQQEFQLGSTKEEAYRNIYRKRGQNPPSYSMIHGGLEEFYDEDFDAHDRTSSFDEDLRSAVIGQYLNFTKTMYFSNGWNFNRGEAVLNSRFMFVISSAFPKKFSIIDSFTGERRSLQGPMDEFETLSPGRPVWIGVDRILIPCSDRFRTVCLRLLKIDWDELKPLIVSTAVCDIMLARIIVDPADRSKFAVVRTLIDDTVIHRGHVKDDQIFMDKQSIEFHARLYYPKLEGGKIRAFQRLHNEERNRDQWNFCDYIIDESPAQRVKPVRSAFRHTEVETDYIWSKNKLYTFDYDFNLPNWFTVVSFDPDTLSWSQTNLAGSAFPTILSVDEDEVLTVSAIDGDFFRDDSPTYKSVYRVAMRKPDNLRYLAWSTIRRGALFFGSDLYERLAPRLPYNSEFRSFLESG